MSTDYLGSVLNWAGLTQAIERTVACIEKRVGNENFDAIAFRGTSGALVAPAVAAQLRKDLILVRKKGDSTHSMLLVESCRTNYRYIIVDDFVCSGATLRQITEAIYLDDKGAKPVAVVLYGDKACSPYKGAELVCTPIYVAREGEK